MKILKTKCVSCYLGNQGVGKYCHLIVVLLFAFEFHSLVPRNSTKVTALNAEFSKLGGLGSFFEEFPVLLKRRKECHGQYFSGVFKEAVVMVVKTKAHSQVPTA